MPLPRKGAFDFSPGDLGANMAKKTAVKKTAVPARDIVGHTGISLQVEGRNWYVLNATESGGKIIVEYGDSGGTIEGRRSYSPNQLLNITGWTGKSLPKKKRAIRKAEMVCPECGDKYAPAAGACPGCGLSEVKSTGDDETSRVLPDSENPDLIDEEDKGLEEMGSSDDSHPLNDEAKSVEDIDGEDPNDEEKSVDDVGGEDPNEEEKGVEDIGGDDSHPLNDEAKDFVAKPSGLEAAKAYKQMQLMKDYFGEGGEGDLRKMDHPGMTESLKGLIEDGGVLDKAMQHVKDALHEHHGEGFGDADETMGQHLKALDGFETGEANLVDHGEVPVVEEDEEVADNTNSEEGESEEFQELEDEGHISDGDADDVNKDEDPDTEEILERYQHPKSIKKSDLMDYNTGNYIRPATPAEERASEEAARHDGGAGVIQVSGRSCYVEKKIVKSLEWRTRKVGVARRASDGRIFIKRRKNLADEDIEVKGSQDDQMIREIVNPIAGRLLDVQGGQVRTFDGRFQVSWVRPMQAALQSAGFQVRVQDDGLKVSKSQQTVKASATVEIHQRRWDALRQEGNRLGVKVRWAGERSGVRGRVAVYLEGEQAAIDEIVRNFQVKSVAPPVIEQKYNRLLNVMNRLGLNGN